MKSRYFFLFLISLIIFGCATVLKITESPSPIIQNNEINDNVSFCTQSTPQSVIGPYRNLNEDFFEFTNLPKIPKDLESKMILWSFINQNNNPLLISPDSGVLLVLTKGTDIEIYNFNSHGGFIHPFYRMIQFLRSRNPKGPSVKSLAENIENNFHGAVRVSPIFSESLIKSTALLNQHPVLKSAYIRGDQLLGPNESIPPLPFSKMWAEYEREVKALKQQEMFLKDEKPRYALENSRRHSRCNFDVNQYKNGTFNIGGDVDKSIYFGVRENKNLALAITYYRSSKPEPFFNFAVLKGMNFASTPNYCLLSTAEGPQFIASSNSRDSGQILSQTLEKSEQYDAQGISKSFEDVLFLYLKNPPRLIFNKKEWDGKLPGIYHQSAQEIPKFFYEKIAEVIAIHSDPQVPIFLLPNSSEFAQSCRN